MVLINIPEILSQNSDQPPYPLDDQEFGAERTGFSFGAARGKRATTSGVTKAFYMSRVFFVYFLSFLSFITICIFFWHILMPANLRWLSSSDVTSIKDVSVSVIVALVMSGATAFFFKKES